jgi:hypothetical protein
MKINKTLTWFAKRLAIGGLLLAATYVSANAQTSGTSTLTVTVPPLAAITINTASTALTASSSFSPYTGTTSFSYSVRTSQATGTGSIQLKITSDFSPTAGPSVGNPISTGDTLTYTCSAAVGTACASTQAASTSVSTSVVNFGADAHSGASGSNGSVTWSLPNDPNYKSGTYTAVATFTISAT